MIKFETNMITITLHSNMLVLVYHALLTGSPETWN
jgi:hypothetical protein